MIYCQKLEISAISFSRQYASNYRQFNVVDCEIHLLGELTQNMVTDCSPHIMIHFEHIAYCDSAFLAHCLV